MSPFEHLLDSREALRDAFDRSRVLAAFGYLAIYVAAAALALPLGFVLTLAGGFLFGAPVGGLLAAGAATSGGTLLFLAARTILADFLARRADGMIGRIRLGFQRSAWSYMLFLRLSPFVPFWLVNVGAGGAGVPLSTFLWTTGLGVLPITFVVAFAGENLDRVAASSATALALCRSAEIEACHATLPLREIVSGPTIAVLVAGSLLALAPALLRLWRTRERARDA